MGRNEDESKYIGSTITEDEQECAHKCCEEKDCSLSWFIAVEGGDEEDEDNCFLVNCDSPHHCRLKDSKLKDSVTHIFRKSSFTTITTTTTGSPRIDPFLKAIANYNLGSDEMKVLVDTLGDLDVKEQTKIKVLIDSVLAEHGGKVSGSSKITTATTSEATPTKNTTVTTTETTTTTTSTTSTESPRMEKESKKTTTKSDSEKTVKAQPKEDTQSSPDKTEKSKRPDWMKPKDSVVTPGTDGTTKLSAKKHSEKQLQPPRIHMGLLTAACVIGVVATVIVLATMRQGVQRAWRKKDYIDADYLINGMYQPNI